MQSRYRSFKLHCDETVAFLLINGIIADFNGTSPVQLIVNEDDYFLVIKHRNHLAVISGEPFNYSDANIIK